MLKYRKLWIIAVIALIVAAGILFYVYLSPQNKEKEIQYVSGSWDYSYSDMEEISQASDRIALVSVESIENTSIQQSVPYTTFSVKVETPVYHCEEKQEFLIYMTGGETEDKIVQVTGDPLLNPGDEILVFCKENPDGTYRILGGPQGRLVYKDGRLNSLSSVYGEGDQTMLPDLGVENADAETLISEIKGYTGGT